jgi:hypothetical protein
MLLVSSISQGVSMNIFKKLTIVISALGFAINFPSIIAEVQGEVVLAALNKRFLSAPSSLQALRGVCLDNGKPKSFVKCKEALQKQRVPAAVSDSLGAVNVWDFIGGDSLAS